MKRVATISLETVKARLRQETQGRIGNHEGWSVYIDGRGCHFYVMDDDQKPVPYYRISSYSSFHRQQLVSKPSH